MCCMSTFPLVEQKATQEVSGSGSRAEWLADSDKQVYAVIDEGF